MEMPLFSERAGRSRELSQSDLAKLIWLHLTALREENGVFAEAFSHTHPEGDGSLMPPRIGDPEAYFLERLKVSGLASHVTDFSFPPAEAGRNADLLLDMLELLHGDCVSLATSRKRTRPSHSYTFQAPFSKTEGQRVFRERLNPLLKLGAIPYEIGPDGTIRELPPEDMAELVDEPLPDAEEPELTDPVRAAIEQFFRRGAAIHDRLAAVKMLADALERLRPEVKVELLASDEQDLFNIANNFGVRHLNREQKLDYNRELWLEWMFYVYLATIRAMLRLRDEERKA